MKKVVVAFIAGALLMASGQVLADSISLIGKKIDGEAIVKLDGKQVGAAVILDGKSYAPVRDIAEGLGATASYENGVITIEKDVITIINGDTNEEQVRLSGMKIQIENKIKSKKSEIDMKTQSQAALRSIFDDLKDRKPEHADEIEAEYQKEFTLREEMKVKLQSEIGELQIQLNEINKQIVELESTQ